MYNVVANFYQVEPGECLVDYNDEGMVIVGPELVRHYPIEIEGKQMHRFQGEEFTVSVEGKSPEACARPCKEIG